MLHLHLTTAIFQHCARLQHMNDPLADFEAPRLQISSMHNHDDALVDALFAGLPGRAQTGGSAAHHHQHVDRLEHEPARRRCTRSVCALAGARHPCHLTLLAFAKRWSKLITVDKSPDTLR